MKNRLFSFLFGVFLTYLYIMVVFAENKFDYLPKVIVDIPYLGVQIGFFDYPLFDHKFVNNSKLYQDYYNTTLNNLDKVIELAEAALGLKTWWVRPLKAHVNYANLKGLLSSNEYEQFMMQFKLIEAEFFIMENHLEYLYAEKKNFLKFCKSDKQLHGFLAYDQWKVLCRCDSLINRTGNYYNRYIIKVNPIFLEINTLFIETNIQQKLVDWFTANMYAVDELTGVLSLFVRHYHPLHPLLWYNYSMDDPIYVNAVKEYEANPEMQYYYEVVLGFGRL